MIIRRRILVLAALLGLAWGCGTQRTSFPNQLHAADGTPIRFEDLQAIVTDNQLTDDEKRQQMRDLGIEDEQLIDALLGTS